MAKKKTIEDKTKYRDELLEDMIDWDDLETE